jgi:hypothetical protein
VALGGAATAVGKYPRLLLDSYGADPTGTYVSDVAWNAAYAEAQTYLNDVTGSSEGILIEAGPGLYKFSSGVVILKDPRIGFVGQGTGVTTIMANGNVSGDLIWATNFNVASLGSLLAAPIGNFNVSKGTAYGNINLVHYGDRQGAHNLPVRVELAVASGDRGFWFCNTQGGLGERTHWCIEANECSQSFVFDGNNNTVGSNPASFDYSEISMTVVTTTALQTVTIFQAVNNVHLDGCELTIQGNAGAPINQTTTLMQVGNSSTDLAKINGSIINVMIEADGAGTIVDINIDASAVITNCGNSKFLAINGSGVWTAGAIYGTLDIAGHLDAPVFSSTSGSLWQPSPDLTSFDSKNTTGKLANALQIDGKNGHLIRGSGNGTPTLALNSNAGSGATFSITGTDEAGIISITTGTTPALGTQASITFANAYPAPPLIFLSPMTSNLTGGTPGFFVPSPGSGSFDVNAANSPAASTVYTFRYWVLG